MTERTITIDLSEKAKLAFASRFSSSRYSGTVQSLLVPCDLLYTYAFRYNRLLANDLPHAEGFMASTQGSVIDYTATHSWVGAVITVTFASIAAITAYFQYNKMIKTREKNSTHYIKGQLDEVIAAEQETQLKKVNDINYYLGLILRDSPDLQEKYSSVKIDESDDKVDFKIVYKNAAPKKTTSWFDTVTQKIVSPAWDTLCLTSFAYWILWIGSGILTGQFGVGIAGMPPGLAFGIPVAVGLAYPIIKVYNYFQSRYAKSASGVSKEEQVTAEDQVNANDLLRRALLRREFELQKKELQHELIKNSATNEPTPSLAETSPNNAALNSIDSKILGLGKGKWKKTAVALLATMGGTYVCLQYGAWIITDILNTVANVTIGAPVVNIAVGAVLLGLAAGYGIYKAVQRFYHVEGQAQDPKILAISKQQNEINDLEATLAKSRQNIAELETKLGRPAENNKLPSYQEELFFTDVKRRGESTGWTTFKKICTRAFHFVNGVCTGAFLGRLFFVKGTAIALPFAAATFSNPITIGILIGIGVAYGAFKVYQYHQQRKEERANALLAQRDERIECLKQEVTLTGMREKLYTALYKQQIAVNETAAPSPARNGSEQQVLTKAVEATIFGGAKPRRYSADDVPAIDSSPIPPPSPTSQKGAA